MSLYEVAILGTPTSAQMSDLERGLREAAKAYRIRFGVDLVLRRFPTHFAPPQRTTAVAVYFGGRGGGTATVSGVMDPTIVTVIPVASSEDQVMAEIPAELRFLNCHLTDRAGPSRLLTTVLECLGLLRRQRRVFLSYRRSEAREAALQLFDILSARGFDVFVDTQSVAPAVDFQETLWHKLCDADVMVMLETPTYFKSRWTSEEFGRALSKNIGVLRVQWPDTTPSVDTQTCSRVEIVPQELNIQTGALTVTALERIADQLEWFRSLSFAVRCISAVTQFTDAVKRIGGQVMGIGPHFEMKVRLANGDKCSVSSVIGVPDSISLHEAIVRARGQRAAVLYDHVGVLPSWNDHLRWLGQNIPRAYWIRSSQAAWDLTGWAP